MIENHLNHQKPARTATGNAFKHCISQSVILSCQSAAFRHYGYHEPLYFAVAWKSNSSISGVIVTASTKTEYNSDFNNKANSSGWIVRTCFVREVLFDSGPMITSCWLQLFLLVGLVLFSWLFHEISILVVKCPMGALFNRFTVLTNTGLYKCTAPFATVNIRRLMKLKSSWNLWPTLHMLWRFVLGTNFDIKTDDNKLLLTAATHEDLECSSYLLSLFVSVVS